MAYCQAMYRARQVEEGHIALERSEGSGGYSTVSVTGTVRAPPELRLMVILPV